MSATVSVIIPTYNRASTLRRAIESCQTQSYPLERILVVDDGSTDETPQLLSDLSREDPRIFGLRLSARGGAQFARIEGIRAARSDWVAFLDSDDELTPGSIRMRVEAAGRCGFEPGLVYGDYELSDRSVVRLRPYAGNAFPDLCRRIGFASYVTFLIRRACFETAGYPKPDLRAMQDEDMMLTIARTFPVLHCGAVAARVHQPEDRISGNWRALSSGCFRILGKYRKDILHHHGVTGFFLSILRSVHLSLVFWSRIEGRRIHPLGNLGPWLLSGILRRILAPYLRDRR